ncbi:hypothetical protein RISK_004959 [Rhodopirellula islandica]|uniref:Uncharacterized protein n=1 Tax=Rhodopirellula islandica TaxID=595434 RepID=A0A0J1EBS5_RHOIS|nr:hypothetical protein RISK_004959 [Rhodopirellula islandica]
MSDACPTRSQSETSRFKHRFGSQRSGVPLERHSHFDGLCGSKVGTQGTLS